jgi:hypothetical protein
MKQKQRTIKRDILFILISSFVVVAAWIGFNLYHITVTSTVSPNIQKHLTPIDPTFNTQTIQALKNRLNVVPAFERQATASNTAAPTPTTQVIPTITNASGSAIGSTPITILGQ